MIPNVLAKVTFQSPVAGHPAAAGPGPRRRRRELRGPRAAAGGGGRPCGRLPEAPAEGGDLVAIG